ncbi:MAG: DUF4886 domain-containing protein [Prevotellaceae bacterium]|nr:DUF4886 domain-containing protein [Prevotellaceae bacterium]
MRNLFLLIVLAFAIGIQTTMARTIKILAIGNSFSEDAIEQYLHELADADGIETIIGNLFIGGCSLECHMQCINGNLPDYRYRKIGVDGVTKETPKCDIARAIADEEWDYVSVQQASHFSGDYTTYQPYLSQLVAYVKAHTKKDVKIVFHQTWAYAQNSDHGGFKRYGNSQKQMYDAINGALKQVIKDIHPDVIVPSGTAIQNARTSSIGDNMNRDGYHLNLLYGRYTAACTWFQAIFKRSVVGNSYAPEGVTAEQKTIAQKAASAAVKHKFKVTQIK